MRFLSTFRQTGNYDGCVVVVLIIYFVFKFLTGKFAIFFFLFSRWSGGLEIRSKAGKYDVILKYGVRKKKNPRNFQIQKKK